MAVANTSWVQIDDTAAPPGAVAYTSWLQIEDATPAPPPPPPPPPPSGAVARTSWIQIEDNTPAPTAVSGDGTGETTATISWINNSGTPHLVQIESPAGSGNWVTAAGETNPTGLGATSFNLTGLSPATDYTPGVTAIGASVNSARSTGTTFGTDNPATGGGEIPTVTIGTVQQDQVLTWGVKNAASRDRSLFWTIEQPYVTSDLTLSYKLLNALSADVVLRYGIRSVVQRDRPLAYAVESSRVKPKTRLTLTLQQVTKINPFRK